jgi:hypothetical protein
MGTETDGFEDEGDRIHSLDKLADQVDKLTMMVGKLIGGAHKDATATTEHRLGEPTSVSEEVQRELARRDEAQKQAERDAALGRHEEALKGLTEKIPEPPVRKVERLMGWRG